MDYCNMCSPQRCKLALRKPHYDLNTQTNVTPTRSRFIKDQTQTAEHVLNHRHSLSTEMWRVTTKNLIQDYFREETESWTSRHAAWDRAFGFCAFQKQCLWFNASMHRANPWMRCALYHMCPLAQSPSVNGSDPFLPRFRWVFQTHKPSLPSANCTRLLWHTCRPGICGHCLWFPWASGRQDGWTVSCGGSRMKGWCTEEVRGKLGTAHRERERPPRF